MYEDDSKFTPLYDRLLRKFNLHTVAIYGKIKRLAYQDGYSHASEMYISKELNIDPKTVHKCIKSLLEIGAIIDVTEQKEDEYINKVIKDTGKLPILEHYGHRIKLLAPDVERVDEIMREWEREQINAKKKELADRENKVMDEVVDW